ncbi:alpha/beta hydrolase [Paracoccus sp. Z118]|uniref:alpha/beta fold hydrolase n=1 Tax=Paracoccus sp. Z118 TaxID=2851017 RepID=UPI001C2B7F3F|nr:alpha/beta hydrolase [Paracoccus sp. Z118]MBV0892149.1 alpha/beta hydrolase [Paracoccus sp. Z118]
MPRRTSTLARTVSVLAASALISRGLQAAIERAVPRDGRLIEVDGTRLHVAEEGSGRPVLMIHGLGGQVRNFTMRLSRRMSGHHMHIVDRPGSGYSDDLPGDTGTLKAQAALMAGLIRRLGLDRPLVVGHSLGGSIALQMALDFPGLIRGAALIGPATHRLRSPGTSALLRALLAPPLLQPFAQTLATPVSLALSPVVAEIIFAPEEWEWSVGWEGGGLMPARPGNYAVVGRDLRMALAELPRLSRRYGELSVPVHVLQGEQDNLVDPREHAIRLAGESDRVRLTLVPGGHMLPITQPGLVAAWLRDASEEVFG